MMKLAGHTMGTPEYTLREAMKLFSSLGLSGIEIIIARDGYNCAIPETATNEEVLAVRDMAEEIGISVSGITPYLNHFNDLNESVRQKECACLRRVIDMAELLGTKNIRIYGGKLLDGEKDHYAEKRQQLIRSMRECGDYAAKKGIFLNMENHFGTMTTTAAITAGIARDIAHPNVGILYDQANLAFFPAEEYGEAISLQKDYIRYVHCKDLVYKSGKPEKATFSEVSHVSEDERTVLSRIPGEGILKWPAIIDALADIGYEGWISLEYERRWHMNDLPDAAVGMRQGAAYIKSILEKRGLG